MLLPQKLTTFWNGSLSFKGEGIFADKLCKEIQKLFVDGPCFIQIQKPYSLCKLLKTAIINLLDLRLSQLLK